MTNTVFAHVPYPHIQQHLEFITSRKINPEIFFSGDALDALIPEELTAIAASLSGNRLKTTIHAPFMDLNPGSVEPLVREATLRRFNRVLDAAEILRPVVIVFHPGYDRWRYGESQDKWLKHSIDTWQSVLERAAKIGCVVAVENIFEEEPSTLRTLFEVVDSPIFRHCFDIGHWNLFKKVGMEEWFAEVGKYIAETHVHDNFGLRDDHLPIGEGNIDFELFFSLMKRYAPHAVYTIEAHDREKVLKALQALEDNLR